MTLINNLYEKFLQKKDVIRQVLSDRPTSLIVRSASFSSSRGSLSQASKLPVSRSLLTSSGPTRINIAFQLEMIEKAIEDSRMTMRKYQKQHARAHFKMDVQEQNLIACFEMFQQARAAFNSFLKEHSIRRSGRVGLVQFSRFLEYDLQNNKNIIRKIKLKSGAFENYLWRLKQLEKYKIGLSDYLHPVDINKLQIENNQKQRLLKRKTKELSFHQDLMGQKSQQLVILKSTARATSAGIKKLKHNVKKEAAKDYIENMKEIQSINNLLAADLAEEAVKQISKTYKSPNILFYIEIDIAINNLTSKKEMWERRLKNKNHICDLLERQLRVLSATTTSTDVSRRSMRANKSSSTKSSISFRTSPRWKIVRKKTPYPKCTPFSP